MDEFIIKIKPLADLLDNLAPFAQTYQPPWQGAFEKLQKNQADALEIVLSCFQLGDIAGLSEVVSDSFLSVEEEFRKLSSQEIKPYLRQEMERAG